jgi:hypothetical protein
MLLGCLIVNKELHGLDDGYLSVPQNFVVPTDTSWPEHLWGKNLGSLVELTMKGYIDSDPWPPSKRRRLKVFNSMGIPI